MSIKELVKDNFVKFDSFRQGVFYYTLRTIAKADGDWEEDGHFEDYQFTVPVDDIGTATLLSEDKAITFMRWIRKAVENNTLIKL